MALELPFYAIASDGSISFFSGGTLAQRPEPGQPNRLYIVFEPTGNYLSRDTGAGWENVGSSEQASSILEKLLTVDTNNSGLNTNFLQGKAAAEFLLKAGGTMTAALVLAGDPTAALHAASKQYVDAVRTYVDSIVSGLDAKPDVRLASNNNHALTGAQTVDGVAVVTGDRILLKNQTAGAENGIWVANTAGAWTRATDADTAAKIKDMYTFVAEGAVEGNRDTGWLLTTDAITLGTTALVYGQFSGPGSTLAGTGLARSGNTISASFGAAAGTITQGNDVRLSDTRTPTDGAVTPAKMSVDNKGTIICTSTTRPASPVKGQLIYETDTNQVLKNTGTPAAPVWANTASASAVASETAAGIAQQGTAQQIIDGAAGNLFATVARLKAYLDGRLNAGAWITPTLLNGWTNFGGAEQVAQYRKNADGTVSVRGVLANGAANTACFTLPTGFRPAAVERFPGYAASATTSVSTAVTTTGEVIPSHIGARVTMSGITFEATR